MKTLQCVTTSIKIEKNLIVHSSCIQDILRPLGARFVIVTDTIVEELYGKLLAKNLSKYGLETFLFSFPYGEKNKTRKTLLQLENKMLRQKFDRNTVLIALGGGVVSDITGFLASIYLRGVPLVTIPTTLMAMTDASIGGKNGVDVRSGKNLIGTFYHPKIVCIDPHLLRTLSEKEKTNGFVEMLKHGFIGDASYVDFMEEQKDNMHSDVDVVEEAIYRSCCIKKNFVEQDAQDAGIRACLNFGHTVAHAYELLSKFTLPHGHAVAMGILIEAALSSYMGILSKKSFERIHLLIHKYGPFPIVKVHPQKLFKAMSVDKKAKKGDPYFVVLQDIGSVHDPILEKIEEKAFIRVCNDLFHN